MHGCRAPCIWEPPAPLVMRNARQGISALLHRRRPTCLAGVLVSTPTGDRGGKSQAQTLQRGAVSGHAADGAWLVPHPGGRGGSPLAHWCMAYLRGGSASGPRVRALGASPSPLGVLPFPFRGRWCWCLTDGWSFVAAPDPATGGWGTTCACLVELGGPIGRGADPYVMRARAQRGCRSLRARAGQGPRGSGIGPGPAYGRAWGQYPPGGPGGKHSVVPGDVAAGLLVRDARFAEWRRAASPNSGAGCGPTVPGQGSLRASAVDCGCALRFGCVAHPFDIGGTVCGSGGPGASSDSPSRRGR